MTRSSASLQLYRATGEPAQVSHYQLLAGNEGTPEPRQALRPG